MKTKVSKVGRVSIKLLDKDGNIKDERNVNNAVVDTGENYICSRMKDATDAVMSHMAVGTDNTAVGEGNTTLGAESARVSLSSTTVASNTITYVASYPAGTGTAALTEAGIFNGGAGGTMLARTVFATINKGASDTLQIDWEITVE